MAAGDENADFFDVYNFELQLREKMKELQWKDACLQDTRRELSETRRRVYEIETQLEDERRASMQLEIRLKSALKSMKRLEEDNAKNRAQQIRTSVRCETAAIERKVLIDQARNARLENMDLKVKLGDRDESLVAARMTADILQASLMELKNSVTQLHAKFHSMAGKLEDEQRQLRMSGEAWMNFTQRVKAFIKSNSNATCQCDGKIVVQDLSKNRALAVDSRHCKPATSRPDRHLPDAEYLTDIGSLHLKMELTLRELRCKLESDNSIEDKLSHVCAQLEKMDASLLKHSYSQQPPLLNDEEDKLN